MISLHNVTAFYGNTPIVQSIDVGLKEGGCLAVLGRNGVGKTTLLRAIMGLTTRTTGEIRLGDARIDDRPTHERALMGLGYVPQGRRILGKLSVRDNIRLGTFARPDGSTALPEKCLEMFPYLADNLDRRAGLLSGGQQQQLAIARALATDPKEKDLGLQYKKNLDTLSRKICLFVLSVQAEKKFTI